MEANFFRRLIAELGPAVQGKRIEKVYQPLEKVWNLKLSGQCHLLFHPSPREGFLFLTQSKPENPASPSPETQWWRKRLAGRRIVGWSEDWPHRRVAWQLGTEPEQWLLMDLRRGLELRSELPAGFGDPPEWPGLDEILGNDEIYRQHPHISPPLRRTLQALDPGEAARLLHELRDPSGGALHLYTAPGGGLSLLAWPLPDQLARECEREVFDDALTAAKLYGWRQVRRMRAKEVGGGGERKRALKKARRNLDKVLQDEERLRRMAGMQEKAQMLQNNLYRLPYTEKVSRVRVQDAVGNARELDLDPEVSILDNMNRWFRQARKGRRGLEVQARRRQGLEREVERLENEAAVPPEPAGTVEPGPAAQARRGGRHRWQGMNVHVFRSSDGFTIVRGRDRKANHRLLSQAAKPFDLWFHAQDGPGAHVVLRRDHEEQEVPRRSMEEAAVIAGLASHYSMADKARVLCALVRNVRKIKGAALGQVQVGKVRESLNVELDQALESRLRQSSSQSGQRTETTGG